VIRYGGRRYDRPTAAFATSGWTLLESRETCYLQYPLPTRRRAWHLMPFTVQCDFLLPFPSGLLVITGRAAMWGKLIPPPPKLKTPIFLQHDAHGSHASPGCFLPSAPQRFHSVSLCCSVPQPDILPRRKHARCLVAMRWSLPRQGHALTTSSLSGMVWHSGNINSPKIYF